MKIFPLLLLSFALVGCETTNSDGSVSRFDADGAIKGVNEAMGIYERAKFQSRIVGYDAYGRPVYAQ